MRKPDGFVIPPGARVLITRLPEVPAGPARPNKYGATPTTYDGVRYASKSEAARAEKLDYMQRDGFIRWWIAQPKFRLGVPENVYIPDFLVIEKPFGVRVEDVKGVSTAKFRRDARLWARYGSCPLWIIRDGKVAEVIEGGGGKS